MNVDRPCCPQCQSHSFSFSEVFGPACFLKERAEVLAEYEREAAAIEAGEVVWAEEMSAEVDRWVEREWREADAWYAKEGQTLQAWVAQKKASVDEKYQQEVKRVEATAEDDPFNVLYDTPEAAKAMALRTALVLKQGRKDEIVAKAKAAKANLQADLRAKKEAIESDAAEMRSSVGERVARRKAVAAERLSFLRERLRRYEIAPRNVVQVVFCESCGHVVGTTSSPRLLESEVVRLEQELEEVRAAVLEFRNTWAAHVNAAAAAADQARRMRNFQAGVEGLDRLINGD